MGSVFVIVGGVWVIAQVLLGDVINRLGLVGLITNHGGSS